MGFGAERFSSSPCNMCHWRDLLASWLLVQRPRRTTLRHSKDCAQGPPAWRIYAARSFGPLPCRRNRRRATSFSDVAPRLQATDRGPRRRFNRRAAVADTAARRLATDRDNIQTPDRVEKGFAYTAGSVGQRRSFDGLGERPEGVCLLLTSSWGEARVSK